MGLFENFPYTNFHEINIDQIIKIMRQMQDEWQQVENDWDSMQDFINNYFDNLDVSEEVLQALQTMAGDGELNTIIDPVIVAETAAWLAEHITPTSPVVDNTLSIAGAAADAKATGDAVADLKEDLFNTEDLILNWQSKTFSIFDGLIDATTGQELPSSASKYTKFTCTGYKIIDFVASAYSTNYGYVFLDDNNNVILGEKTETNGRKRVFVPDNAVQFRLCWKNSDTQNIYIAVSSYIEDIEVFLNKEESYQDITRINKNAVYNAATVGNTVSETPSATSASYGSQIIPVQNGDTFIINGTGATSYALWAFTNASRTILTVESSAYTATDKVIVAPADGYLYFQPNFTVAHSIKKKILGGIYRKRIVIESIDAAQTFYNKFVDAFNHGNCDVFIQSGTYTLTNAVIENAYTAYGGIPIGRGNKYYFEPGAKVVCNYTGSENDVKLYFSVLSSSQQGGDYYIENAHIEARNIEYVIHDECNGSIQPTHRIYKNCVLSIDNTTLGESGSYLSKCIGGGLGVYTTIEIENCIFSTINLNPSYAGADASYHGPNNKTFSDSYIYVKDSYFNATFRATKLSANTSAPYPTVMLSNNSFGSEPAVVAEFPLKKWNNEIRS